MAAAVELLADSLANDDQAIPVIRLAMLELKGAIPLREWAELSKDLRGAGVALSSSGVHMPPVTEWRDVPRIIELLIELIRTAAASGSFPALTPP